MNYKCLSFATALMLAAPSCFGVRPFSTIPVDGMDDSPQERALAVAITEATSGPSPVFATLMPLEQPTETNFIHQLRSDGTASYFAISAPIFSYDEVNRAALSDEDYARIKAGESVRKVVGAAIRRFAREHDVPQVMAPSFSVAMGTKDKKEALLGCICDCFPPINQQKINKVFADRSEHFLTQLLKHFTWIWPSDTFMMKQNKRFFVERIGEGMDFDGAATLLLTSKFSVPGEVQEDPNLDPLIQSLSVPVRLRASSLKMTPPFMKMALTWVASQDEERALASLFFLTICGDEERESAFMAASSALSPAYMLMFVNNWPSEMTIDEFTFILAQGDLTKRQLKGLMFSGDRQAIYASRKQFEGSLFSRLLASLE